jgi:3-hydroxyisobutyrate dehydrogenase-like beta-hydroxyacid dehydrogenase
MLLAKEIVMVKLGFIGLGVMGSKVTKRLLDAGYTLTGYNRTQSKAQWLLDAGMHWGSSPRAVAESADVVFTMVSNTVALQEVFYGPDGLLAGLSEGKVFIDMSTVSPTVSGELASQVAEKAAHMLNAPVSANTLMVEQGSASLMIGGDQTVFEQVKPILLAIGPKVSYIGTNDQAVLMKIAINVHLYVQYLSFCEGLFLAVKGGIPIETALNAMANSAIISPALKHRTPFILDMPEEAWFDVNMMQKDMLLGEEMSRKLDMPLPVAAFSNQFLTAARAMGLAKKDFAIVYKVLATMGGLDL